MKEILVIIPAYNEAGSIERVVEGCRKKLPEADYLVVNDGSSDDTAKILRANGYRALYLPVNLGLAGAFRAGMRYADEKGYRAAVQFDGDGQHRAEYIPAMYEEIKAGAEIVIASRFVTEKKPRTLRMLGSRMITAAIRLASGVRIEDPTSGMRMYNRRMIELFSRQINYPPEPDTLSFLAKNGVRFREIQAEMDLRTAGTSYLTPWISVRDMTRMLLSIADRRQRFLGALRAALHSARGLSAHSLQIDGIVWRAVTGKSSVFAGHCLALHESLCAEPEGLAARGKAEFARADHGAQGALSGRGTAGESEPTERGES